MSSQKPVLPDVKSDLVVQTNDQCEGDHKLNEACDEVIKEVEILIPILKYFQSLFLCIKHQMVKSFSFFMKGICSDFNTSTQNDTDWS